MMGSLLQCSDGSFASVLARPPDVWSWATSEVAHCRVSSFSLSASRSATSARTERAKAHLLSISKREKALRMTYRSVVLTYQMPLYAAYPSTLS